MYSPAGFFAEEDTSSAEGPVEDIEINFTQEDNDEGVRRAAKAKRSKASKKGKGGKGIPTLSSAERRAALTLESMANQVPNGSGPTEVAESKKSGSQAAGGLDVFLFALICVAQKACGALTIRKNGVQAADGGPRAIHSFQRCKCIQIDCLHREPPSLPPSPPPSHSIDTSVLAALSACQSGSLWSNCPIFRLHPTSSAACLCNTATAPPRLAPAEATYWC